MDYLISEAELLTKDWLVGIRKGWLSLLNPQINDWDDVFAAFDRLIQFVENLQEQVTHIRPSISITISTQSKDKDKLESAFNKLLDELKDLKHRADHWERSYSGVIDSFNPNAREEGRQMFDLYKNKFNDLLEVHVPTKINVSKGKYYTTRSAHINELLDNILKILRSEAKKIDKSYQLSPEDTKEIWEGAPKEFFLGDMKIIIADPKFHGRLTKRYVPLLLRAKSLIEDKGFGKAWKGLLFIQSSSVQELSPAEKEAYAKTGVMIDYFNAKYHWEDFISITSPPENNLIEIIAHEIGHRYWFKFMSEEQRRRFEDFIDLKGDAEGPRKAKPVSEYGKSNIDEAFAEVFAHYVLNKDMDRDQIESFKAVLKKAKLKVKDIIKLAKKFNKYATKPISLPTKSIESLIENKLVPRIADWLNNQPDQDQPLGHQEFILSEDFLINNVKGDGKLITIIISSKPSNSKGTALLGAKHRGKGNQIILYLNGALSPNDFLIKTQFLDRLSSLNECTSEVCLPYCLYSHLIHELTHAKEINQKINYDSLGIQEGQVSSTDPSYINDPLEVRAFMQNIVSEVMNMANKIKQYTKDTNDLIEKCLTLSTTWGIINQSLNEENKKLILKAIYRSMLDAGIIKH